MLKKLLIESTRLLFLLTFHDSSNICFPKLFHSVMGLLVFEFNLEIRQNIFQGATYLNAILEIS